MARISHCEIINCLQMREAERITIEGGTSVYSLMQKAGEAVASEVLEYFKDNKILILCGPGNNGGDGFVAAKILKEKGRDVRVACYAPLNELKGDTLKAARELTGKIAIELFENIEVSIGDVVVDSVFGSGFSGEIDEKTALLFDRVRKASVNVVAVDMPSGVNGGSGAVDSNTLQASMTITFFRKKLGHVLMPGLAYCGPVAVHDIGIEGSVLEQTGVAAFENNPVLWHDHIRRKSFFDHKYSFGHVVVMGGRAMTGAALLAAHSAMRVRAGICTIVGPEEASVVYRSYLPSLIFEKNENPEDFCTFLEDVRRTAALIGPGAGMDNPESLREAVLRCCEMGEEKGLVIDADAINVFQGRRDDLVEMLHANCVITPHEGEFVRLFDDLEGTKIERTRDASSLTGAVILLKGPDTVIATPDGRCVIDINGPPLLATAGTGDVLAGMVAGLLAQGVPAFEAACAAAWIQGEAAFLFGPGLISADLPDLIPSVLRELS